MTQFPKEVSEALIKAAEDHIAATGASPTETIKLMVRTTEIISQHIGKEAIHLIRKELGLLIH